MVINKIREIYFSPTNTTKTTVESISQSLGIELKNVTNLTKPLSGGSITIGADEVAVIGVPVYGGRVPLPAVERLKSLKGTGTPAILAVVYGNRHYDDALLELSDILSEGGFIPVAGGAFIGEHSFGTVDEVLADGRPDVKDREMAGELGRLALEKLAKLDKVEDAGTLALAGLPGNRPYKERNPSKGAVPFSTAETCTLCGKCAAVCPVDAIAVNGKVETEAEKCILCSACVKTCPTGARYWDNPGVTKTSNWLIENCRARREAELFI